MFGAGSKLKVIVSITSPQPAPVVRIFTTIGVGTNTVSLIIPDISYWLVVPVIKLIPNPFGKGVKGSSSRLKAPSNSRMIEFDPVKLSFPEQYEAVLEP